MKYGIEPDVISVREIECREMMFYLYLPIKMSKDLDIRIPERLKIFQPLINDMLKNEGENINDKYIYLTAKHVYVTPDNPANRPGYHSDGFGTDDINYIWTNKFPTVFCIQDFSLSEDCNTSISEMEEQVKEENEMTFMVNTLLRLDQFNVHRCPTIHAGDMRTFVKISISNHKYNLVGNSHNFLFDYDWKMFDRDELRNHPTLLESDFMPEY